MGRPRLLLPLLLAILMAGCAQGEAPSEVETRVEEGLGTHISPLKAEIRETEKSKRSVDKPKDKKATQRKRNKQKKQRTRQAKIKGKGRKGKKGNKGKGKKRKGKGKDKKKWKGKKSKKKKKSKKTKRKNGKTNRKNKNKKKARQQCGATSVDDDCIRNAVDALNFEKNQIQNFFKTEKRSQGHKRVAGNKMNKNDQFNVSAHFMLMAIGGNLSSPTCGDGDSTTSTRAAEAAMANYKTLVNCSATIMEACEMPNGTHTMNETFYDDCGKMYNKTKKVSEDCRMNATYENNGPAACACWKKTMEYIVDIKEAKCTKKGQDQSKMMNTVRKKCINAFRGCKKAEDAAIALIASCMSGDVDMTVGANEG